MLGILLKFVAQAGYMHVDGAGQGVRVIAPDGAQEFNSRNRASGALDQVA